VVGPRRQGSLGELASLGAGGDYQGP
jgi:hypothetical protein